MRILLVEDHQEFANVIIEKFLTDHEIDVVDSVELARRKIISGNYDVLLVDYDLNGEKGVDIIAFARNSGFKKRIIAISSHDVGNSKLLKAGADVACPKLRFSKIQEVLVPRLNKPR